MTALIESQFLPPISTFSALKSVDLVVFDLHSHYVKGSYRNRSYICGANGRLRLSVPLSKGKHQKTPLGEVRINYDEDWKKNHWQSIISAYGRSAYFEFYRDEFCEIFFQDHEKLVEFNHSLFQWICNHLNFSIATKNTEKYIDGTTGLVDLRDFISPQPAKMKYDFRPKPYEQVFANQIPFLPDLSIIDLLFTHGPMAKDYF